MEKLSGGKFPTHQLGWNATSDPCQDHWHGVHCYTSSVGSITLNGFRFTGTLDAQSLCSAKSLAFLKLPNNTISGQIPEEIGLCTSLLILDLSGNRFSGSIPENLGECTSLTFLKLPNNTISGKIPKEIGLCTGLLILDLSDNRFSGSISENLGECTNLTMLDLSNNRLSGSIPNPIPRLTNRPAEEPRLTSFHVEQNFLSRPITGFDFGVIASFNVSNNNFSGPLPDGAESYGAGCFLGNPGLCGYPLSNSCSEPKPV
ncbi:Probable LRR receptor-like serine/threonine-protein kinase At1g12460 [Linum grandiflorum]